MPQPLTIRVNEVVGSELCIASDDGQKVHDRLAEALRAGRNVCLSFLNVDSLTSAFLNAAVGQLYAEFSEDEVRSKLSVSEMGEDDLALLKRVVETAKAYFQNPREFEEARKEVLGEDDDDGGPGN